MLWISKSKIWTSDWNVSLLLACDWTGSSWQLHVVINCDKLVKIRNVLRSATNLFLSTYRQIHDNYLHPESRQNLTNLKEKFWNSSPKRVTAESDAIVWRQLASHEPTCTGALWFKAVVQLHAEPLGSQLAAEDICCRSLTATNKCNHQATLKFS